MMQRTLRGFLLVMAFAFAGIPRAEATSIAQFTEAQMVDASTYIVRGKVVDLWTEVDETGMVWTRAGVEISRTFKGPDSPDYLVVDVHGGTVGGMVRTVPAAARFSEGEDVLLFLTEIDFGRKLSPVGMSMGKFTIRRAPGDTEKHVMRWSSSEAEFDARFLPYPDKAQRVYLDDLLDRVETRLDAGWDGKPFPGLTQDELSRVNTPEWRKRR